MAIRKIGESEAIVLDSAQPVAQSGVPKNSRVRKLAPDEYITLDSERDVLNPRATSPTYYPKKEVDKSISGHLALGAVDATRRLSGISANLLDTAANKVDSIDTDIRTRFYEAFGYPEQSQDDVATVSSFDGSNIVSRGLRGAADYASGVERDLSGQIQSMNVQDSVTFDEINPLGNKVSDIDPLKVGRFVLEQGAKSIPEAGVAFIPFVGAPLVAATTTQNVLEERNVNQGQDANQIPTGDDLKTALTYAVPSAALERIGVLGDVPTALGGGAKQVTRASQIPSAVGRSALGEATTEAIQENLELQGATQGTDVNPTIKDRIEVGIQGALVGGPMGGAIRGATEATNLALNNKNNTPAPLIIENGRTQQNLGSDASIEPQPKAPVPNDGIVARIPAPLNRDDLTQAIENNTPLPENKTIDLPQIEIDPVLQQQGFVVGTPIEQKTGDGESIEGSLVSAQIIDGELEVTIVDTFGNLRTLFESDGTIDNGTLAQAQDIATSTDKTQIDNQNILESQPSDLVQSLPPISVSTKPKESPKDLFTADTVDRKEEDDPLSSMSLDDLIKGMDNVNAQAKQGGWNKFLTDYKRKYKKELDTRFPEWDAPTKLAINDAVQDVNINPTDAQKEAGNYKKGHVSIQGLSISIENPKGSIRSGKDSDGNEWQTELPAHYGYLKGTNGADGDQIDVYVGESTQSDRVYIIDQIDPQSGEFDEVKAMVGYNSQEEAVNDYFKAFSDGSGPSRAGAVSEVSVADFKEWINKSKSKKAFSYKKQDPNISDNTKDDIKPKSVKSSDAGFVVTFSDGTYATYKEPKSENEALEYAQYLIDKGYRGSKIGIEIDTPKDFSDEQIESAIRNAKPWTYLDDLKKDVANQLGVPENYDFGLRIYNINQSLKTKIIEEKGWRQPTQEFYEDNLNKKVEVLRGVGGIFGESIETVTIKSDGRGGYLALPKGARTKGFLPNWVREIKNESIAEDKPVQAQEITYQGRKIYKTQDGKWAVQDERNVSSNSVLGDTLHSSLEDAKSEIDFQIKRKQSQQKMQENSALIDAQKIADKNKEIEDFNKTDVGKFLSKYNKNDQIRFKKSLMTLVNHAGHGVIKRHEWVEKSVKDGMTIKGTNSERRLVKGDVFIDQKQITKIGMDYAQFLNNVKASSDAKLDSSELKKGSDNETENEKPSGEKIQDFGEKLEGAKKDLWQSYSKTMSDELPDDQSAITVSKHFPEPDYERLIAEGVSIDALATVKALRDQIPSKPRKYGVKRWVDQFTQIRDFANDVIKDPELVSKLKSKGEGLRQLDGFFDRINLYKDLGYPAFTKAKDWNVRVSRISRRSPDSNEMINMGDRWVAARKSYFGDDFDTYEQAIAHVKKKIEQEDRKPSDKKVELNIYRVTKTREIIVGKKVGPGKFIDLQGGFKTSREAAEYMNENYDDLVALLNKKKDVPPVRRSTNDPRKGEDYREGRDISPQEFTETFGFRGVQFGNYVEQSRRVDDLNNAYDALTDLARIIGIPEKAISLDGQLGLAFGARGSGGKNSAAAHYEPGNVVINLTKINGAGSLGHEWFHAMDNYFGKQEKTNTYLSQNNLYTSYFKIDDVREEVQKAFRQVMKAINSTGIKERSKKLDGYRSKDYWSTPHEMIARSFEAYLIHKADLKGYSNDYLANLSSQIGFEAVMGDGTYPYPTRAEMVDTIAGAFDNLFDVIDTKQTEAGVAMYSLNNGLQSYLLDYTKNQIKQEKGTGAQFLAMLRKADGIKEEEIEWTGLDDFLKNRGGVTKQEIVDYLEANQVQIEEVTLGSDWDKPISKDDWIDNRVNFYMVQGLSADQARLQAESAANAEKTGQAKFSQYTLAGGTNYREVLMTLPEQSPFSEQEREEMDTLSRRMNNEANFPDKDLERYNDLNRKLANRIDSNFKSRHYDQANILAHVRLNDRTDADGKRVLFIEEIQSDWHQAGRKKGYKGSIGEDIKVNTDGLVVERKQDDMWNKYKVIRDGQELYSFMMPLDRDVLTTDEIISAYANNELREKQMTRENQERQKVPDAPFKKSWHEMAFRRVVQMAAQGGYDRVAWTTGEQQNERYDLSKQVDQVEVYKLDNGNYNLEVLNDGKPIPLPDTRDMPAERIEDFVGKDVAKRAIEMANKDGEAILSGVDLKIGGDGMKGFYDNILVKYANKFGKKFGAQVSQIQINTGNAPDDVVAKYANDKDHPFTKAQRSIVNSLDITDAMREVARTGLALFRKNVQSGKNQITKSMEDAINKKLKSLGWSNARFTLFDDVSQTPLSGAPSDIDGAYWRKIIYVSMHSSDILSTIDHEVIHGLKDFGAFTDAEWKTLESKAAEWRVKYDIDNRYKDVLISQGVKSESSLERRLDEEAIAHAFQDFDNKGVIRRIVNKAISFIKAIGDVLRGKAFNMRTADDVFQAVRSGKIGARIQEEISNNTNVQQPMFSIADKINSPAFKRWFGDSKVVDENGKPLVVYHSTTSVKDFDAFKRLSHFGTREQALKRIDDIREDIDPNVAPERVFPVYISMKNPIRIDDSGKQHEVEDYVTELENLGILTKFEADDILQQEREPIRKATLIRYAKEAGYDGFVYNNVFESDGGDSYVIFNSSQVKSIFNQGTFDADESSIMYQLPTGKKQSIDGARLNLNKVKGLEKGFINDLNKQSSIFLHPQMIASLHKGFVPVYNSVIGRYKQREVIFNQLMGNTTTYNSLTEQEKKQVHAVLEIGRLSGKTYKPNVDGIIEVKNEGLKYTHHSKEGDFITLTPSQTASYLGLRKSFDLALDKIIDTILEEEGLLEQGIKSIQDVERLRLTAQKNGDVEEVKRLSSVLQKLNDVNDSKKTGYIPLKRWGKVGISVKNEEGDVVYFERVDIGNTKTQNKKLAEIKQVNDALDNLPEEFLKPEYTISTFEMSNFNDVVANIDLESFDVIAHSSDLTNEEREKFIEAIKKEMQKRGFRSHFFRSRDIPGYSADFERSINDYFITASSYISRRLNDKKIEDSLTVLAESGMKNLYEYGREYVDYINDPIEEWGEARMTIFMYYLSGNVSSGLVNLTQPVLFTAPWFKGKFSSSDIAIELSKAYKDIGSVSTPNIRGDDSFDFSKAPLDVRDALIKAQSEGDFLSQATHDAMAVASTSSLKVRGARKRARQVADAVALTFSIPEKVNRIATFISAYRLAMKPGAKENIMKWVGRDEFSKAMLDGKDGADFAFAYAELAVVSTQYRVGKLNRARVSRGIGTLPFQFLSFTIQTLELIYRLSKVNSGQSKASVAYMMFAIVAFSGLKGIPFTDDLQELYERLYKLVTGIDVDIDFKAREVITEYTGSKFLADTLLKGLPASVLNMDLSGRLGFGSIAPDRGSDFLGVWFDLFVERPLQASQYLAQGRAGSAVRELLPAFLSNPLQAMSWESDGVYTKAGSKVIDAEDITGMDVFMKSLGFTTADISNKRDSVWSETRANNAVNELRKRYYGRMAKAIAEGQRLYAQGDFEGQAEMQRQFTAIMEEIRIHNEGKPPHLQIIPNQASIKQRVKEELRGADERRIRKQARPRVQEIREIYGY